jgi:hypothetical protein
MTLLLTASKLARIALCLALSASIERAMSAQTSDMLDIAAERPSVGSGPEIVPSHSLQMETGLNALYSKHNYVVDLPEAFLRLGIGYRSELRFTASNIVSRGTPAPATDAIQFQDIVFGVKTGVTTPNHFMVQSVVASMSLPSGGPSETSGTMDVSFILIWTQSTANGFSITENVGGTRTSTDGIRQTNWSPNASIGHAFSKSIVWYMEYATTIAPSAGLAQIVDGGFSYNTRSTSQFDLRIGVQSDDQGVHNILSIGHSFRLDKFGETLFRAHAKH